MDTFSPFHNPWVYRAKTRCSTKCLRHPAGFKHLLLAGLARPTCKLDLAFPVQVPCPLLPSSCSQGPQSCLLAGHPFTLLSSNWAWTQDLSLSPCSTSPHRSGTAQGALDQSSETRVQILVPPHCSCESLGLTSPCPHCLVCDAASKCAYTLAVCCTSSGHTFMVMPLEFGNMRP